MAEEKQPDLKVKVVDTKPCSITLNIEVPHADVVCETDKVYQEIYKVAKVPGFRPGKAPMDMVKKNYLEAAREKVIENLLHKSVFRALENQKFNAIDSPVVSEMAFDFDKPFSFTIIAEKHPEFKVKDYKGIKVKKEVIKIGDEEVKKTLDSLLERNSRLVESKSDSAQPNSFLVVDYECFLGTEQLAELGAKNQMIDLSSSQVIPGFREGLSGSKKNEEKVVKVKFPADYPNKNIAGKDVDFKVKVLDIKEKLLPALDDEFAKDVGAENLADLKKKIKDSLEHEEKKRQDESVEKQIFDSLLESNKFPVPDTLVEEQKNNMIERMSKYLGQQGYDSKAIEKNVAAAQDKYKVDAEKTVRLSYILGAVAKEEELEADEKDLEAEFDRIRKAYPGKEKEVEKYISEKKNNIKAGLKEQKIFKYLTDNAKISESTKKS